MHNFENRRSRRNLFTLLISTVLLASCALPGSSLPPAPSPQPGKVETIIAETAVAAQAQTATHLPPTQQVRATSTPTKTATPTPSPTATILFTFLTNTQVGLTSPSTGGNPSETPPSNEHNYKGTLACALVGQSPPDGTVFGAWEKFTVHWTIKNTGTASWKKGWIDYRYVEGDKFHDRALYNFNYILDPGETFEIKIDMHAPKQLGSYETTWAVSLNKEILCKMTLAIVVK